MSADATELERDLLSTPAAGPAAVRGGALRIAGYAAASLLALGSGALLYRHLGVVDSGRYTAAGSLVALVAAASDLGLTAIGLRELAIRAGEERVRMASTLLGLRLLITTAGVLAVTAFALIAYGPTLAAGVALAGVGLVFTVWQGTLAIPLMVDMRLGWTSLLEFLRQLLLSILIVVLVLAGAGLLAFLAAPIPAGCDRARADADRLSPPGAHAHPRGSRRLARAGRARALLRRRRSRRRDLLPRRHPARLRALQRAPARLLRPVLQRHGRAVRDSRDARQCRLPDLLARRARRPRAPGLRDRARVRSLADRRRLDVAGDRARRALCHRSRSADTSSSPPPKCSRSRGSPSAPTFVGTVWGFGLLSLGRHRAILLFNLSALASVVIAVSILASLDGARGAAIGTSAVELANAIVGAWLLAHGRAHLRPSLRVLPKVAVAIAIAAAPALLDVSEPARVAHLRHPVPARARSPCARCRPSCSRYCPGGCAAPADGHGARRLADLQHVPVAALDDRRLDRRQLADEAVARPIMPRAAVPARAVDDAESAAFAAR